MRRRQSVLLCAVLAAGCLFPADARSQAVALAGNGSLTLALDAHGRVSACRWPGPCASNHVPGAGDGSVRHAGLVWALRTGGHTLWLDGAPFQPEAGIPFPSPVAHVRQRLTDPPIEVIQRVAVHPEHDVAVLELTVLGLPEPPEVFWFARFSPVTRDVPEWRLLEPFLSPLDDFACFASGDRQSVFQFRPRNPGSLDWGFARNLVRSGASADEWSGFNDGVYLKCASPNPVVSLECGTGDGPALQVAEGRLGGTSASAGQSAFAIQLEPATEAGVYRAAVVLAMGSSLDAVGSLLPADDTPPATRIFEAAETAWREWLGQAGGEAAPRALMPGRYDVLWTLYASQDRATGAMARAPVGAPGLALDWPRFSVWADAALDTAALHEAAGRHLRFLASAVRDRHEPGAPSGSLALALRADGSDGLPHLLLDTGPAAWFLWGVWRHAEHLRHDPGARDAFLAAIAEPAMRCGRFLAEWEDPVSRRPRPIFDTTLGRDAETAETPVEIRMGLARALAVANATGTDMPEWRDRIEALDELIRQRHTETDGSWNTGAPAVLALSGFNPVSADSVAAFLAARIEARDRRDYNDRLAQALVVCEAAGEMPPSPGRNTLVNLLNQETVALQETPEGPGIPPPPCDTALTALRFLVWELNTRVSS